MNVTTIEYKIKCMAYLSYSTLTDLAEYFHLSPVWGSEENIAQRHEGFHFAEKKKFDFSQIFDLPMDEQKCCSGCKHKCYVCIDKECCETVDCAKSPCESCGKVNAKCKYQQLREAILVFKNLLDICHADNNFEYFESENDYVFPQFPFCYNVELLWDRVNTSLEFCLDFLLKTGYLNEETMKDRLMDFRLILKRSKSKIAVIFGNELSDMFKELTINRPESIVVDDEEPINQDKEEAGPVDSYYYNLPNGKKVWLKNNVVLRKTFTLIEKVFNGALFKFESDKYKIIKSQHQVNSLGWQDLDENAHEVRFSQGNLLLTTSSWQANHNYDVRVLLSTGEDRYQSIEYYGCTAKEKCSDLNDDELRKNWKFDELKLLIKKKDILKLKDIFSANKQNVHGLDPSKCSLLHWTAQYSSHEAAILLLKNGCDPLLKNKDGATAYHQAANYNSVSVMKVLIASNYKGMNAQDVDMYTPLHYACLNNGFDMVRFLTDQKGINVDLRNKKGKKADEVYAKTRDDIKKLIMICRAKSA
ncbi:uncharacterized protein [Clytia hemisphaerica]|uniref:Uncharacterized protein n=1 Tax=Clytia hemisphaerica TaxID=252671 RepID=A0A7M5WRA1_9CNID|eukprot:TCONS_00030196-protein